MLYLVGICFPKKYDERYRFSHGNIKFSEQHFERRLQWTSSLRRIIFIVNQIRKYILSPINPIKIPTTIRFTMQMHKLWDIGIYLIFLLKLKMLFLRQASKNTSTHIGETLTASHIIMALIRMNSRNILNKLITDLNFLQKNLNEQRQKLSLLLIMDRLIFQKKKRLMSVVNFQNLLIC